MIKKELRSYRKVSTRDYAQKLHVFRYRSCENDCCKNNIYNNDINIKNYFLSLSDLTNKIIFKLIINAFCVKTEIVNFITFSFLFCDKLARIELFIENRIYL